MTHTPVIVGDFNIYEQDATNAFCKGLIMSMGMFDLCQHVRQPTHILGNTLDLVITLTYMSTHVIVSDWSISDHYLVCADLQLQQTSPPNKQLRSFCSFKNISIENFYSDLRGTQMFTSPSNDVNTIAEQIVSSLIITMDTLAPLRTTTIQCRADDGWQDELITDKEQLSYCTLKENVVIQPIIATNAFIDCIVGPLSQQLLLSVSNIMPKSIT